MPDSIYKVIELVGTSPTSWEDAVKKVVDEAGKTLKDLRIAEVYDLDVKIENNKVAAYRAKVKLSFKYEK
jgi:flavin-binding protein dodecin